MALRELSPGGAAAAVQNTTFSIDALARNICNTWDEAVGSGGPPFTVIVVGSGAYGGYRLQGGHVASVGARAGARGGALPGGRARPESGQRRAQCASPIAPENDPGVPRELVWGLPWRGNVEFPGLAYCCGGKSLFWGGWCPRLTPDDLAAWPAETAANLIQHYDDVERDTGVVPDTDFIQGDLLDAVRARSLSVAGLVANLDVTLPGGAVQTDPSQSRARDRLRPVQLRQIQQHAHPDGRYSRRHRAIRRRGRPEQTVTRPPRPRRALTRGRGRGSHDRGRRGRRAQIPHDRAGPRRPRRQRDRNDTARARVVSDPVDGAESHGPRPQRFTVRIRRTALAPIPDGVQTAALLLRGRAAGAPFHLQVTASTEP